MATNPNSISDMAFEVKHETHRANYLQTLLKLHEYKILHYNPVD